LSCVTIPIFVAVGQTVWVYVGGPKNLGDGGSRSLGLTPRNILLPTCVTVSNLVILGQTIRAYLWRSVTPHTPPFKVTETDTDQSATYDFLLMFHSNYRVCQ